ncbi:hypothetical protein [Streptomyces sp. NPDC059575]|uniref:hypothetical protein n=1 Tax=Streptomyces sp. NPDC059575 TaxID=3346872 RepID=UPI00368F27D6
MQDRYHVVAGPPLSPRDVPVEGLGILAAALNALDHPAAAALDGLTAAMVELAFNSLPPKYRQEMLRGLGIHLAAPRRAGRALCRDILTRLRRESRQHASLRSLKELTFTVMNDVGAHVFAPDEKDVSDPVSRWGEILVRTTVFAWCSASVADAYVLAWLADRDWLGMAVGDTQAARLDAVRAAAQAVVAANPGFAAHGPDGEAGRREPAEDVPSADHRAAKSDASAAGRAAPAEELETVAVANPAGDVPDLEEVCRRLASDLATARLSAETVTGAVADGRPPHDEDLAALTALTDAFARAGSVFRSVGVEPVPLRLDDLTRAAQAHRVACEGDLEARATLRGLLELACGPESHAASAAEAVRGAARRLLDSPTWTQTDREESAALTDLARLVRLGRQPDAATEILALQERVVRALPTCAMAAVMAYELSLPRTDDAPAGERAEPGEPQNAERVPESAEPPAPVAVEQAPGATPVHGEAIPVEPIDDGPAGDTDTLDASTETETAGAAGAALPEMPEGPEGVEAEAEEPTAAKHDASLSADDRAPVSGDGVAPPAVPTAADDSVALLRATHDKDTPGADAAADEARIEHALAQLVVERRFGLAHHLACAAGRSETETAALRLAGAAALLASGTSRGARLVTELLQQQSTLVGRDSEGSELILLPALLRTALVTGDHTAGAQLKALVPRLPGPLGEVATAVADRALSGALMAAPPLVVIADVSETEARLGELREQCQDILGPQRLRFARANEIAKHWLALGDGMLGTLLMAVINDDRGMLEEIRERAERLSKLSEINNEIDRMDRRYRSSSGKPLQGSGRHDLVHLVERVTALAKEWCLAVDGTRRGDRSAGNRAVKEVSALRKSMLNRRETVLTELEQLARRSGAVPAAAAWAARASMEELFDLLAGDTATARTVGGVDPELVLDVELLKVCDTVRERPPVGRLLTAVHRGWDEALAERLEHDAFSAARTIVALVGRDAPPGAGTKLFTSPESAELDKREESRRAELRKTHGELVAELHRAQADGAVTDDQDLRLQEFLADARTWLDDTGTHDLLDVRRSLETVQAELPAFRKQATDRIRARLDALDAGQEARAQVLRHLDTGGLATAADLVYFLEINEEIPEIEAGESHLTDFFPVVPDGLPKGIDAELVELVRSGGKHPDLPVLDYGSLSSDEAALAADALNEWRGLRATQPNDRLNIAGRRQLPPILRLLGYDAKSAKPLDESSAHRREHRRFEAIDVEVNGRAKVPAFGSQIKEHGGSLRVLMVWGRPPAEVVMSVASRDTTDSSLLVIYFGTLSRDARVELAVGSARLQPLLVVDDAALAYLAARGNRQASTTTQTLLPFAGVNPYIREKRGRIGGEMFYGRDAERKSILDPQGTQVIFGGRGLGKSALLSDAGERFMEKRPGHQQSVYVNLDQENIGKGSSLGPEALWSVLERELVKIQVIERPQGRKSQKDISDRIRTAIQAWLDGDSRRRLLILLDECDQFFEADAPRFDQTKKLKGLGSDTKDRAKVVFAGLHSVQRFSKLASNGPFGHLAQTPKVIGPLAPQFAADLLVEPMRALGFEFQDVDLVNRVLGYCSYQPFLLQMFGHRLVELMHRKRAIELTHSKRDRRAAAGPPYTVEVTDIEAVEADTGLRDGISAAFKDTLSLDHRYDVIANVLAYHARHQGLEVRLSDAELREECETFWRQGFEQLDTEGFRSYLSEMVGLGVLAPNHDGQGWHLRGPNALRMIGSSHEVDARLLGAERDCELQESIVLEGRPELPDGRPAPLTITQLDDLLGERANQTRVVLGTLATGVTDVGDTLRAVAGRIADWKLPPIGRPSVYKQELVGGRPRERRVVIGDFARYTAKYEACREAIDLAETQLPKTPGVTRAVVLVTNTTQLALWRPLLTGTEPTPAVPVVLRRHDRRSLRGWAQRVEMFHTDDRLDRLHALTSGWPVLVDRAHRLHGELGDADEVLRRLAGLLTDRAKARSFARETGVYDDALLATGYRTLAAEFKDGSFDMESAVTAIACQIEDEDEARWIFTCLDALQVFDREDTFLRLEPLLRQCVALEG